LSERLTPTPPLFSNGILFLLAIFISLGAFQNIKTVWDVLVVRPPLNEKFWILDWEDAVLEHPVFPEMSQSGPTEKSKNKSAWGNQCSEWAKRAGFVGGIGLHACRREALIKIDGKFYVIVKSVSCYYK
jgi:hypothetical protein